MGARRLGLVLSSGGVRGVYAHTGFLMALEGMGITPDALAGCSAGAVVGGVVASGRPVSAWAEAPASVRPRDCWHSRWGALLWSLLAPQGRGLTGVSSTDAAREFTQQQLQAQTFEACPIPFRALAVHVASGRKRFFSEGELLSPMVASAAIPLLYEPVAIAGEWYCDGALLDLAPTDAICCQYGLDVLIIHHVAQRQDGNIALQRALRRPWSMLELLNLLLYQRRPWYLSDQPLALRHCPCGCGATIVILEPELPALELPLTTSGPRVQEAARQQAGQLLQPWLAALKGDAAFPAAQFETNRSTSTAEETE